MKRPGIGTSDFQLGARPGPIDPPVQGTFRRSTWISDCRPLTLFDTPRRTHRRDFCGIDGRFMNTRTSPIRELPPGFGRASGQLLPCSHAAFKKLIATTLGSFPAQPVVWLSFRARIWGFRCGIGSAADPSTLALTQVSSCQAFIRV